METPERIGLALITFLSSPIKPGSLHRLVPSGIFEARLGEAYIVARAAQKAFKSGEDLGSGRLDAKSLGLGRIISSSIIETFDSIGEKPIPGVHAAVITLSLLAGLAGREGRVLSQNLSATVRRVLYRSSPEDSVSLVESLEAVGASSLVEVLEKEGIRRSTILAYGYTLGDIFEKIQDADTGFSINMKGYGRLLTVYRAASKQKNLVAASIASYLEAMKLVGVEAPALNARELVEADRRLRSQGFKGERLLGLAAAGTALAYLEKPMPISSI
ncbi:hypothetical protein [Aeropyrum pernix]|uniref:hypothetical protein n=1 Tax=Aeropyrum pernix TaxID=56636 RepID=UPI000AD4CBFE|nr:hypothetical protein [Aeropyrum pernix]